MGSHAAIVVTAGRDRQPPVERSPQPLRRGAAAPEISEAALVTSSAATGRRALAWSAHLFTATGAVLGLFALLAVIEGDARACLLWLGAALVVDAVDGSLARWVRVRELAPRIDGVVLDLVIDYLTYVVVPALFLRQFGLLPDGIATALAAYILATSLYCFANTQMKSADNDFVGFPAIWNAVALYLWILDLGPAANAAIVLALGVLTFTPVKFPHPFRVRGLMPFTIAATALWAVCGLWLVLAHPARPPILLALWLVATAYGLALCLWRTLRTSDSRSRPAGAREVERPLRDMQPSGTRMEPE